MNEQICDECRNRDVPVYAYPCCNCVDGNKYEPDEATQISAMVKKWEGEQNATD